MPDQHSADRGLTATILERAARAIRLGPCRFTAPIARPPGPSDDTARAWARMRRVVDPSSRKAA